MAHPIGIAAVAWRIDGRAAVRPMRAAVRRAAQGWQNLAGVCLSPNILDCCCGCSCVDNVGMVVQTHSTTASSAGFENWASLRRHCDCQPDAPFGFVASANSFRLCWVLPPIQSLCCNPAVSSECCRLDAAARRVLQLVCATSPRSFDGVPSGNNMQLVDPQTIEACMVIVCGTCPGRLASCFQ